MNPAALLERDFELIEICRDARAGCLAFVAVHSTRLGPAFGGVRRWRYPDPAAALRDALRLAEAMTLKCAIAEVPGGGGKAVIVDHPGLDRDAAYRLVGRAAERLSGAFCTGPDVGTEAADLEVMAEETRHVATLAAHGDLSEPTALGVCAGIEHVARRLGHPEMAGAHVAVQGLGAVGWRVAQALASRGARLTVADLDPERCDRAVDTLGAAVASPDQILSVACDILAPCALGSAIDKHVAGTLPARAVAGAANNVLATPECGAVLFGRGVLYAPDFVMNAGALIHGALFHLNGVAPPAEQVLAIGPRVGELIDRARLDGTPPEVIAERWARDRVAAAEDRRRT